MIATLPHRSAVTTESRPWGRALLWLTALGPFFFLSYGFANWVTSLRSSVPAVVFGWEPNIPFVEWTIVPYWSSDLMYAVSFFVCATRLELDRHAKRLLAAQLICVAAFLLFPLRFTFERPAAHGLFGFLFAFLGGFDKPFNQAPSLHLALNTILWARFSAHLDGWALWLCRCWLVLVGLSTLTTYQHHFIDLPTGVLVGLISIGLFPLTRDAGRVRLAAAYLTGSLLLASAAFRFSGAAWALLWPALALLIVATAYVTGRPGVLGKGRGVTNSVILALTAPYVAAAWINSRLWISSDTAPREIGGGVWIGRLPSQADLQTLGIRSMVDLTAELPARTRGIAYVPIPMLDLVVPSVGQLHAAVKAVASLESLRPTLICCALGYSRSAAVVSAWLLASGRAPSIDAAIAATRKCRPRIVLGTTHRQRLEEWAHFEGYL